MVSVDLVSIEPRIPSDKSVSQLRRSALDQWFQQRTYFGLKPKPAHRISSTTRRHKTLNYLRHRYSNYDQVDLVLERDERNHLRSRFNEAITEVLQELAP